MCTSALSDLNSRRRTGGAPLLAALLLLLAAAHGLQIAHARAAWLWIGAPLAEELVFRAWLQSWLQRRAGPRAALIATSAAFAACHVAVAPSWQSALTFLPSLLLGALYARTGSLGACVVLHAAFNAAWSMGAASLLQPLPMP